MKKTLLVPALALTMAGTVLFATSSAFAQGSTDAQQTLVEKIAQQFNLNKDDVQKVFDDQRATHQAKMQQSFEDKLSQLVKDGKLTEEQKTNVLAKFKDIQANRTADMDKMKSMTPDERKKTMKAHKDELDQWAKDNGIDLSLLMPRGFGRGMHMKHF